MACISNDLSKEFDPSPLAIKFFKDVSRVAFYTGIPTAANVPVKWIASFDLNPTDSLREKESFLSEAAASNYVLFFQHDIYNECCTLQRNEKGIRLKDTFNLDKILK